MMGSMSEERKFSPAKPDGPYDKCPDCGGWKAQKAYRCRECSPRPREAARRRWVEKPSASAAHSRAIVMYPVPPACSRCHTEGPVERHHIDDDPANNEPLNILMLCRRCHMEVDGRLAQIRAFSPTPKPAQKCVECGKFSTGKYLRRGLCHACNERKRRREKKLSV